MLTIEEKRARAVAYYHANRKRYLERGAERRLVERDVRRETERARWAALSVEEKREKTRKAESARQERKYGLREEQREKLLASQNGGCAICGKPDGETRLTRLNTGHDHLTNEVRGLLCGSCAWGLGLLGDTEEVLLKALTYLRKERTRISGKG